MVLKRKMYLHVFRIFQLNYFSRAKKREMTVGRFVTAANEVNIGGFWREHAKGEEGS